MSKSKHTSNGRMLAPSKHIMCEEQPKVEPLKTPPLSITSSITPIPVPDLSTSPYRIGANIKLMNDADSVLISKSPSSPMMAAMREAVDSITQYEDFEIVENIGAGFYADVFKVRY